MSMRAAAPPLPHVKAGWWLLTVLIGLATALEFGLIVAIGARLRSPAAGATPVRPDQGQGSGIVSVPGVEASQAARGAAVVPRVPAPDPVGPSNGPPAPQTPPVAPSGDAKVVGDAAARPPGDSILDPRPVPTPAAVNVVEAQAGDVRSLGRELFASQWQPNDPRCHGGDGLGPVYNAASCLDCHNLGGPGGAGPADQNVQLATGVGYIRPADDPADLQSQMLPVRIGSDIVESRPVQADLERAHPGFRDGLSTVLHRFGVDPDYDRWRASFCSASRPATSRSTVSTGRSKSRNATGRSRSRDSGLEVPPELADQVSAACKAASDMLGMTRVAVSLTERNTPPLFGTGLIDGLDDREIRKVASYQPAEVRGRIRRLKDGRIGRFGWKAQVATLGDFVLTACANELGLEVPGHHQAASPLAPHAKARALDLTPDECNALVDYVRSLPPPVSLDSSGVHDSAAIAEGRKLFESIGCAACHIPDLGPIRGLYSDLLLHDMGERLSDPGDYYADDSDSPGAARRSEWRTPPLWGFRDSAPYLHDGRARDLDQAVMQHGGQGATSAQRFLILPPAQHSKIQDFLNSLAAPGQAPSPEVPRAAGGVR